MRPWASNILTIGLLLAILVPLPKHAAAQSDKGPPVPGQSSVIPDERRVVAPAAATGIVTFRKPAIECPKGSEFVGNECVPSCANGMVRFGANCVSDGTGDGPSTVTPSPEPEPTVDLARPLQEELKRIGCLTGKVDGIWGPQSRRALSKFARKAGLSIDRSEPTADALREARDRPDDYCKPEPCPSGESRNSAGRCVPSQPSCPGDTYREGGKCVCDSGLVRQADDSCAPRQRSCPGDTFRSGSRCVCESGFVRQSDDSCARRQRSCPGDTFRSGSRCVCDSGFVRQSDDSCARRQRPCPGDLERDGNNCVCADDSTVRRGIRCVPRPLSCPSGYRPRNGTCVRIGPRCRSDQYVCGNECCYSQSEPGGSGNRKKIKRCLQICGTRLIGCMLKYQNERKCQSQLQQCKARYGC